MLKKLQRLLSDVLGKDAADEAQTEIEAPNIDGSPRYFDMRITTLYRGADRDSGRDPLCRSSCGD